jgi:hypothetical protein
MGLVFTPDAKGSGASPIAIAGGVWLLFGTLTFSNSPQYATGGDPLDLTKFVPAMGIVRAAKFIGSLRGLIPEYDVTNKKLLLWNTVTANTPTEHANATNYAAVLTASPVSCAILIK